MSSAKVFMTGRVSNDPKLFANNDGSKKRLLFNVACNTKSKDYERADFIPCIMWGDDRVKAIKPWLLKGRLVEITGELRTYDKRDEDGKFLEKIVEVQVTTLEFLDRKPEGVETPDTKEKAPAKPAETQSAQPANQMEMLKQLQATIAEAFGALAQQPPAEAEPDNEEVKEPEYVGQAF